MDVALRLHGSVTHVAEHRDLPRDLLERPRWTSNRASRVESRPDVTALRILGSPPRVERAEAIFSGVHLPVELRSDVVEPALTKPFARVRKRLPEGIETIDAFWIAGAPNSERADANGDPRLGDVHPLIERRDEIIDVVPAPIVAIGP